MIPKVLLLAALPLLLLAQEQANIPPLPDSPFSAVAISEITPTNGSSTATKFTTAIDRDSKGRTRTEDRYPLAPSDTGQGLLRQITICDPVAHTRTELNPETMQATTFSLQVSAAPPASEHQSEEDLGVSTMEGRTVHGYRHSMTIQLNHPTTDAGKIGDDGPPITFTNEYWYSEQLQVSVKTTAVYTSGQTRSVTLTQIALTEPDEALFLIPSDYKLIEAQHTRRIGRAVAEANLITHIDPAYPPLAKSARIQGTVEFTAIIGTDGVIKRLELVRGHPLLVNAAKEAVLQWRYRPTLLNGDPVPVEAPVIVSFTLADQE